MTFKAYNGFCVQIQTNPLATIEIEPIDAQLIFPALFIIIVRDDDIAAIGIITTENELSTYL